MRKELISSNADKKPLTLQKRLMAERGGFEPPVGEDTPTTD